MFLSDRWQDYELIDTGNGEKLERWSGITAVRPEPAAVWPHDAWPQADAYYERSDTGGGRWVIKKRLPSSWRIAYTLAGGPALVFALDSMGFKHTGVFPEQASNWDFIYAEVTRIRALRTQPCFLNLFAYTGGATLAMAAAGAAEVVHVDAAKGMLARAKENQNLSGLTGAKVRYLADDAVKFVKRELRRGRRYDGIVLDPPTYGRGPTGEMWRIEAQLYALLADLAMLLPESGPAFMVLNTYSGMTEKNVDTCMRLALDGRGGVHETDELGLIASRRTLPLSLGVTTRWTR